MDKKLPVVAFFPAHPAQLWLMYSVAKSLEGSVSVLWILRDKDVLLNIAKGLGLDYIVLSKAKKGLVGNFFELLINIFKVILLTKKYGIDLWFTKYGAGNIGAYLCKVPSLSFNDDDIDIVPLIAITSYPFAKRLLAPTWVRMGRYDNKTERYFGSHELVYLHPSRFHPDRNKIFNSKGEGTAKYLLIRLSALTAHHDLGVSGVGLDFIDKLIELYDEEYTIGISTEKELPVKYEKHILKIDPCSMHHYLYFASCIVTDSLSMALEAAILGTASIRLSDFGEDVSAFKICVDHGLIYNFSPKDTCKAYEKIEYVLNEEKTGVFKRKGEILVEEMEDPLDSFTKSIKNFI